jgi:hypothetical protein
LKVAPLSSAPKQFSISITEGHEMSKTALTTLSLALATCTQLALAGPIDPECSPEKAAKSAATQATVGVGGRCDAKEAASDTAKRTAGVDDKGPAEKRKDDTPTEKAKKKVDKATN